MYENSNVREREKNKSKMLKFLLFFKKQSLKTNKTVKRKKERMPSVITLLQHSR